MQYKEDNKEEEEEQKSVEKQFPNLFKPNCYAIVIKY